MRIAILIWACLCSFLLLLSCKTVKANRQNETLEYTPTDKDLFEEILLMDKVFFEAYNNCDLEKQASIYSDNIEFFHDKGGLMTSKKEILQSTQKFICGKVTRQLVKESVEVYPIKNYGAVQIGYHKFYLSLIHI